MAGMQHLYRRGSGIYFVRLCVPARLRAAVGKGEIHRSTGVRDHRLAKIVAAELVAHWHRAIQVLERMDIRKIKAGAVDLLGDGHMPLRQAATALGATTADLAERLIRRQAPVLVRANNWQGWTVEDISEAVDTFHDSITGEAEFVIDDQKLNRVAGHQNKYSGLLSFRLRDEALEIARGEGTVHVCQFLLWPSWTRGFIVDLPGQALDASQLLVRRLDVEALRLSLASQITSEMLSLVPVAASALQETAPAVPAGKPYSMRFSEFMVEYMKRHEGFWKPDQVRRRQDQLHAFLELVGDLRLADIDRAKIREFSDLIARVPDDRHNVKRRHNRPDGGFHELIALADELDLPRLTVQAQQRMLDGISEIFTWAVNETLISTNPAKGLGGELAKRTGRKSTKAHEERDPFNAEDLTRIFAALWFRQGHGQMTPQGRYHSYRPHYYWLPLLALYQGGRLNELSQLYLDDIKVDESGVVYLDFNLLAEDKLDLDEADRGQAGDKSLKTINAQRLVPVHQKMLELGLMDYVNALRSKGYTRLFPELSHDKTKGYGKAAGSWFNERYLGRELDIPRNGRKTFHSFRHNFATALGQTNAPVTIRSDLMGHSRATPLVDSRYNKGGDLQARQTVINMLNFSLPAIEPFNVTEGLQAVADALRLKQSHSGRDRT